MSTYNVYRSNVQRDPGIEPGTILMRPDWDTSSEFFVIDPSTGKNMGWTFTRLGRKNLPLIGRIKGICGVGDTLAPEHLKQLKHLLTTAP